MEEIQYYTSSVEECHECVDILVQMTEEVSIGKWAGVNRKFYINY